MAERTITIPESLYRSLIAISKTQGLSPISWIAAQIAKYTVTNNPDADVIETGSPGPALFDRSKFLTPVNAPQRPLSEILDGLIDAVDNRDNSHLSIKEDDPYGDLLAEKFADQGIYLP